MSLAQKNPYTKYEDHSVFTAPKEELTLMLYDGALKFVNQAIIATENKNFSKANDLIMRVEAIIQEFQLTLDFKYEVSNDLNKIYDYMYWKLIDANMKKDLEALHEVRDMIRDMRDTWKEAMKKAKTN
ncbi:MAG: flagellar export chaperone FliS [Clostridiales bacterium]|nr:flagellar export chaperone FliS [Clostridiales bacterium]